MACHQGGHPRRIHVESYSFVLSRKQSCKRKAYISEADDTDFNFLHGYLDFQFLLQVVPIPFDRFLQALPHAEHGVVAEEPAGLVYVGEGVWNVAGTVGAVDGLYLGDFGVELAQVLFQISYELVKGGALAVCRVVDLVYCFLVRGREGEHVHLYDIVDICEVTAVFPVSVDSGGLVPHELLYEKGDDRGVCAVGVLTAAEDIEVSQTDVFRTVGAGEHIGIELIHVLCDGIRREGPADDILNLWQSLAVTVGGAAGCEDEASHSCVPCGYYHVEESAYVHGVGGYGVLDGAGNGAEGRLVEHVLHAVHGLAAVLDVADVADYQLKVLRVFFKQRQDVLNMSCREVVEAADIMPGLQEMLAQVGADESGPSGY